MRTPNRDENGMTPTQAKIFNCLADGEWHSRDELCRLIDDDRKVLKFHVACVRKIVAPKGLLLMYFTSPTAGIGLQLMRKLSPMELG